MAFNFNWSPLMADAGFYTRAQDLLTAALNKSPKPPIIVDDIKVTELNLGSIPPDLEILEVGDLAEDRFRGIFKMSYNGDAFLTLKTRVQANPLNTFLVTRPSFASPKPLAAASGLTIPLQITLSEFRLSGFVVLVFSKQKGITVVFRNDPLESLKLRALFMDELPAIIHRLSLRLWVPEYRDRESESVNTLDLSSESGPGQDPLASPPQDPVDASGNALNPSEVASLSLDSGVEIHNLFSHKNLLRLAALTDSQRTLSLFTPSIKDVVYRAWTASAELGESNTLTSPTSPVLSRTHSHIGSLHSFVDNASTISMQSGGSSNFSGFGSYLRPGRHSRSHTKKRKKRVVDLRRPKTTDDVDSVSGDSVFSSENATSAPTIFSSPAHFSEEKNDDPVTPPLGPQNDLHLPTIHERRRISQGDQTLRRSNLSMSEAAQPSSSRSAQMIAETWPDPDATPRNTIRLPSNDRASNRFTAVSLPSSAIQYTPTVPINNNNPREQVWLSKMAAELARRMQEQKIDPSGSRPFPDFWDDHSREEIPPPAYGH
ncbi:ERMES complex subunit [Talaromyces marneffei ATCC 18224]